MSISGRRASVAAGALLLALLALPPSRQALEAGMRPHMLLQYPLLMLAGALLLPAVPQRLREGLRAWNVLGISGLCATAAAGAVLMIPRVLDLALADARADALKFATLLLCGALLRASWQPAGRVIQAFFLGTVLPMTVVAGAIYQDAPLRLCNAYGIDEQQRLGGELTGLAIAVAIAWLWRTGRELLAQERTMAD